MDIITSKQQNYVNWPGPYPAPQYVDHPSPAAAQQLGANYAHSPEFVPGHFLCTRCIVINMTGSRARDRLALAGQIQPPGGPRGYDCHHIYDFNMNRANPRSSAQFVLRRSHIASYNHAGAAYQYGVFFGVPYRGSFEEFDKSLAAPEEFLSPEAPYSKDEVERFEKSYRPLPAWLRQLYLQGSAVPPAYRFGDGRLEYVQSLAPLFAKDAEDCGADTVFDCAVPELEPVRARSGKAVPFAFDPCGNIFLADGDDVFLFDHESFSCEAVTAVDTFS